MDSDRELLELAAKAAGIEGEIKITFGGWPCVMRKNGHAWQPMHDDGDALRLAVKLELVLSMKPSRGYVMAGRGDQSSHYEETSSDPATSTRRAIVRAAASIGASLWEEGRKAREPGI